MDGAESKIILSDRIEGGVGHNMPEAWLRARVRGWMSLESPGMDFWIGSYTADGKWISCSSNSDTYRPKDYKIKYAQDVCRHLNKESSQGGAWLAGWIRNERVFYILWKDPDGDIQIPIEAEKPFIELKNYTLAHWLTHATAALGVWSDWHRNQEYGKGQTVKLAQGQQPTQGHGKFVPPVAW